MLTDGDKERFGTDGFIVVKRLISADEAAPLIEDLDALASGRIRHATWNGRDGAEGERGMRQIPFPSMTVAGWQRHAYRQRALAVARELLGDGLEYVYDQAFVKPPGCSAEVPWHQDAGYWGEVGRALTCWLALSTVTREAGGVEFIPGSHLSGTLPHARAPLEEQYRANPEMSQNHLVVEGVDPRAAVCAPLEPGDATFHHFKTLHRSGPNTTAGTRRGLATHIGLLHRRPARHLVLLAERAERLGRERGEDGPK
jgi:ectoine hydroxylase-related dioxygenase (phytanoyl-CoA dioxygenase family)